MDTYIYINCNCVRCGRCVIACSEQGEDFLVGRRDVEPRGKYEYVPCHHCEGFWDKKTPCQKVCYYNAIELERW